LLEPRWLVGRFTIQSSKSIVFSSATPQTGCAMLVRHQSGS